MIECHRMEDDVKLMSERCGVSEGLHYRTIWRGSVKWSGRWRKRLTSSWIHDNLLLDMDSAHRCMHTQMQMSINFGDHLHEIASQKIDFTFALRTFLWTITWNNVKTFTSCARTARTVRTAWMLIMKLALSHLHSFIRSFVRSSIIVILMHRPYYKIDIHTLFWHKHVMLFLLKRASFWFERFIEQQKQQKQQVIAGIDNNKINLGHKDDCRFEVHCVRLKEKLNRWVYKIYKVLSKVETRSKNVWNFIISSSLHLIISYCRIWRPYTHACAINLQRQDVI
jgi:hypothetical protein